MSSMQENEKEFFESGVPRILGFVRKIMICVSSHIILQSFA
ncbi:hypothetical protein [Leptospira noguchii]|nr:hypothetical protein [Leptospira noguchii]